MEETKMSKEEFFELAKNRNKYTIKKQLPGDLWYAKPGDKYFSQELYESGYNIAQLVEEGYLVSAEEPFDWQNELIGKNVHSVKVWCPECQSFGTNMPLEIKCGICGYEKGITYYDAQTINDHLVNKF